MRKIIDLRYKIKKNFNESKYLFLFLILGLIIFTYPMIVSGFDLMPGHMTDAKFINYILEHSFQWLMGAQNNHPFWTAPFYYPRENTLAYSDALIGIMPVYCAFRFIWSPLSAFQVTFIFMCVLNYTTFYYLLKKQLNFSDIASSLGAFLFAFSLMRFYRTIHIQYFPQFFEILTLIFLMKVNNKNSILKNNIYFLSAIFFLSLQFYTCVSLGYYFIVIGILFIAVSLCFNTTRKMVISYFKNFWKYIVPYLIAFIISLVPLFLKYFDLDEVRTLEEVDLYLQNIGAWIRNVSVLDSLFFKQIEYIDFVHSTEITASVGIFTSLIALFGIYKYKNFRYVFFILLTVIIFMSCKVGDIYIWQYLYYIMPGAKGIRAIIRISFIALIILSLGMANCMQYLKDNFKGKFKKNLLYLVMLVVIIETIPYTSDPHSAWRTYCWSKSAFNQQLNEAIKELSKEDKVIYFKTDFSNIREEELYTDIYRLEQVSLLTFSNNLRAMWVAMITNRYSLNGYSGVIRDPLRFYKFYKVKMIKYNYNIKNFTISDYFLRNKQ